MQTNIAMSNPRLPGTISFNQIELEGGIYRPILINNPGMVECRLVSDGMKNVFYFGSQGILDKISSHSWHTFQFVKTNEKLKIEFIEER